MSKPEFYVPVERTRKQAEALLVTSDEQLVHRTLIELAYYDEDWRWVQQQCLERLHTSQSLVRSGALYGLQILAVVRHKLEPDVVASAIYGLKSDPAVAQLVQDILDDIHYQFPPH